MERKSTDLKELERLMDEDFYAALNMIGEGAPDYLPSDEEDEELAELKRKMDKEKKLH
ncbi:MAG TPA: hypothetical protein VK945_01315 [Planococcus sp. (in: firmicutes)]|nr:hypothetical protein [Planococcus sp. (in: firmicutes)]